MLNYKKIKFKVFTILLSLLMMFSGCQQQETIKHFTFQESQPPAPTFTSQITEEIPDVISEEFSRMILEKYRPENATAKPDFSGEITDLRFTVVHREHLPATGESELIDDLLQNRTYLQIYYGYLMDGQWHDMPCENYALRGIFNLFHEKKSGDEAAGESHIVKIGPYLVICVQHNTYTGPQAETYCKFRDTLGTKAVQLFSAYYTPPTQYNSNPAEDLPAADQKPRYGYFKEDVDSIGSEKGSRHQGKTTFDLYYFLVLEYDSIPEDYKLEVFYYDDELIRIDTLTYEKIITLIEK